MKILTDKYLKKYIENIEQLAPCIEKFKQSSTSLNFDYLTEVSSVFSSNIEGNTLDINSFMNFKMNKTKSKDVEEIEDLIQAYHFAQNNILNEKNFLEIHKILSKTLLIPSKRGSYRDDKVGVFGEEGLIYLAIEAEFVGGKMLELFEDIDFLMKSDLSNEEVFYYAALIHLVFVHIHPFSDGNGRCARILEKWFVSQKLGKDFWMLSSERYYNKYRDGYYANINLGVNYYELNYDESLPFLLMLADSICNYK